MYVLYEMYVVYIVRLYGVYVMYVLYVVSVLSASFGTRGVARFSVEGVWGPPVALCSVAVARTISP